MLQLHKLENTFNLTYLLTVNICLFSASYVRKLTPHSCLHGKYEATTSSWLA